MSYLYTASDRTYYTYFQYMNVVQLDIFKALTPKSFWYFQLRHGDERL